MGLDIRRAGSIGRSTEGNERALRMKFKLLAGAALVAVFTASSAAAQVGWYGAADIGYHWPEGLKGTSSNLAANGIPYTWKFSQKDDWTGFARLGYQVTDNWRVEL